MSLLRFGLLAVALLAAPSSQAAIPTVTIDTISVNPSERTVVVEYTASSSQAQLRVDLRVSGDDGRTFLIDTDEVSGDVGFPVEPGPRSLTWTYAADLVPSDSYIVRVVVDDLQTPSLSDILAEVSESRLQADVEFMEGRRHHTSGLANHRATRDYIETAFTSNSLQAHRQAFQHGGWSAENIIGRWPGTTDEADVFIIDGHFDTVANTLGADDNASGTAGMLEAMRVLSQYRFARTIKFIGFDLEEVGLVGALRYVQSGRDPWDNTLGVVNFEMIGFTCTTNGCDDFAELGNYIHNIGDTNSTDLRAEFDLIATTLVPDLVVLSTEADPSNPNFRRSDHARFWDVGIPALFLTDGANFRNPHYHKMTDTSASLNYTFMANIVRTTAAMIAKLAGVQNAAVADSGPFLLGENVESDSHSWGELKSKQD